MRVCSLSSAASCRGVGAEVFLLLAMVVGVFVGASAAYAAPSAAMRIAGRVPCAACA